MFGMVLTQEVNIGPKIKKKPLPYNPKQPSATISGKSVRGIPSSAEHLEQTNTGSLITGAIPL